MTLTIEEGLYVMNADGSSPRRIVGEMGRRPQNLRWSDDGNGLYFTAAVVGTSNLMFTDLEGEHRPVTEGNHMVSVTDIQSGRAVGTLTSYHVPRNLIAFDVTSGSRLTRTRRPFTKPTAAPSRKSSSVRSKRSGTTRSTIFASTDGS